MCYGLLFSGFDVYDDCGIERYSINKAIDVVDGFPLGSDACAESTGTACQIGMFLNWSRGQTDIYGLFCEFVAPPRKKNWLLFLVRDMSWGLRNPCFTKFSVVSFL